MSKPETSQKESLDQAAERYYQNLRTAEGAEAMAWLRKRGLSPANCQHFRFGIVLADGVPTGHEKYVGRISIPYITRAGVVSMKFRCMTPECDRCASGKHGKYTGLPRVKPRIYNVDALMRPGHYVSIAEGELSAAILHQAGLFAVGVPGVQTWAAHMTLCFRGYETVFLFRDGDDAGKKFCYGFERDVVKNGVNVKERVSGLVDILADVVSDVRVIDLPTGHDPDSYALEMGGGEAGAKALRELIGLS